MKEYYPTRNYTIKAQSTLLCFCKAKCTIFSITVYSHKLYCCHLIVPDIEQDSHCANAWHRGKYIAFILASMTQNAAKG